MLVEARERVMNASLRAKGLMSILAMVLLATLLPGCCVGGEDTGQVLIGLTDADGDFLSYTVDVLSLTLENANGDVVDTLPLTTRIDFTEYTEMTEFMTAATVPTGHYVRADMRLDYSDADIQVEVNSEAVAAEVQDAEGNPITTIDVTMKLSEEDYLIIAPGVPSHLIIDFDLRTSNEVDSTVNPPVVTVDPVMIADVNLDDLSPHRLRGLLRSVDTDADTFDVRIRPFSLVQGDFGTIEVTVEDATVYEIDGQTGTGSDGLALLAEQPSLTPTIVAGDLSISPFQFIAREVYAGSSVPHGTRDVLTGHVTARAGDVLTVRGASIKSAERTLLFNDTVSLLIGGDTRVTQQALHTSGLNKDDISVGQRIMVFGELSDQQTDTLQLDATNGHVRMLTTTIIGTVNSIDDQILSMGVQAIGLRRVAIFDFSGTGSDGNDADPENYEVSMASLNTSTLSPSDPVKIRGFASAFGQAPPDFLARTVVDVLSERALMLVSWQNRGVVAPFAEISPDGLVVDLTNTSRLHHLFRLVFVTDLNDLLAQPTCKPTENGRGCFTISRNGSMQVYTSFAEFEEDLESMLDGRGNLVKRISASGAFDDATTTLTTRTMTVLIR